MQNNAPTSSDFVPTPAGGSGLNAVVLRGAIVSALGGLLFGFDTAVIPGTTKALKSVFVLDEKTLGVTVAIALVGTVVGSFAAGKPADVWGRKKTLMVLGILYFISALGCAFATTWFEFLASRFLGGVAVGASSVVAPMYIAEISPPRLRGRLVAVTQFNVVLGILIAYASNYLIASLVDPSWAWRWMVGVMAFPSVAFFALVFWIPESPRWLVLRERIEDARGVLGILGVADRDGELGAIRSSLAEEALGGRERLFQPRFKRSVYLAVALAMFNQLSGINAIVYYAPTIFELAGAGTEDSLLSAVILGATNLFFTMVAMSVIDRFGRRFLMIVGSVGTAACLGLVTWQFLAVERSNALILSCFIGYMAFFAFSQGTVIWVFISEIFPTAVRAKGQALGSFTHWFMATAITGVFPWVAKQSGAAAFGFFAVMLCFQLLFALFIMPETKGGALEDIEKRLASRS